MVDYDLVVIGGGAAGLGAARAAARTRARVLMVSDGPPGGDCTFTGCVPSKTLIEAAAHGLPFPVAARRVGDAVAAIAATETPETLRGEGIDVMLGRARFVAPGRITVDGQPVTGRRFVIATGAAPLIPPVAGLAEAGYLTNESVFDLPELPGSLAVLGGGAIGCELAQAFARLGARVTVVEALDRLLPNEEPEASRLIADVFTGEGIDARVGARVEKVTTDRAGRYGCRWVTAPRWWRSGCWSRWAVPRSPTAWTCPPPAWRWTSVATSSPTTTWAPRPRVSTRPGMSPGGCRSPTPRSTWVASPPATP
jgi:pyruvate/2-oxoglutarate dehydrogenase complex dihydrolipoamide dehydrogenase (E3) component